MGFVLSFHHATPKFPARFLRFFLAPDAGRFIILAAFNLLHDAVAFALFLKAAQRFFN
jgi:hypothetical protein